MDRTFCENARRIKEKISMRDYLEFNGCTIRNNRCSCPVCGGRDDAMQISGEKATCYKSGCIKKSDIIDLHMKLNNMNSIEALNDMIDQFNIERYIGDYDPRKKNKNNKDKEFKREAKKHLEIAHDKLYNIKILDYEILCELDKFDYCMELMNSIDAKKNDLMYNNKYNKEELRNLYKNAINLYKYIKYKKGD